MNQTTHKSLTALFKVIKAENPPQYAVIVEEKDGIKEYVLSRPFTKALETVKVAE